MICDRETVAADAKRAASMRLADVPALHPYRGAKQKLSEATQKMVYGVWRTLLRYCEEHGIETVGQLPVIQSWLGNSTAAVTRIYARVEDRNAKRAAMASFPQLGRPQTI